MMADSVDVLVVGSGPVGLLAAIEIATRGCTVRIIDAQPEPVQMTKASGIAARSLEVLPQSVVDKVLASSVHVRSIGILEHSNEGEATCIAELKLDKIATYQGMRAQMQWLTEKQLTEHMETLPDLRRPGHNLKVERPYRLSSFRESTVGVECDVEAADGETQRVSAKFLLGCDGGSSFVRKGLGFPFHGEATPETFFALHADLEHYTGGKTTQSEIFFSKGADPFAPGFAFSFCMPDGGVLMIVDLDHAQQQQWISDELDRHGERVLLTPTAEDICKVAEQRGCGQGLRVKSGTVKWISHFRVNSRQAEHYGGGRVYLAGDACHCHSPLGGQGMNMGFQDAKNIAWKLAYAAKGAVPTAFLETYEEERRGIEKKICGAIEVAQKGVSKRNSVVFWLRGRGQRLVPTLLNFVGGTALSYLSQQGWSYSACRLSVEHWERPPLSLGIFRAGGYRRRQNLYRWNGMRVRAGDAVPEASTEQGSLLSLLKTCRGFSLLLFEGDASENDLLRSQLHAKVLDVAGLRSLGETLRVAPDEAGFAPNVDQILVFPADDEAHRVFGVRGQCCFLVRPDLHVGLRSEPVHVGVVQRYFKNHCGMDVQQSPAPASSPHFDRLPFYVHSAVFSCSLAFYLLCKFEVVPTTHNQLRLSGVGPVLSSLLLVFLVWSSWKN